jgi:hypothetical protein
LRNQQSFKDLSEIAHVEGEDGTGRLFSLLSSTTERKRERKNEGAVQLESVIVKNFQTPGSG